MAKQQDTDKNQDANKSDDVKVEPRPTLGLKTPDVESMTERDRDQAGASLDPREQAAHESPRPKRVTMQGQMKLSIPPDLIKPNYTPRWFRDKDARIAQAQAAYWEHIKTADGKNLCRPSGPYMLYAMQLPNEYAEEDRALKRGKIAARISKEAKVGAGEYTTNTNNSAIQSSSEDNRNPFNNS